MEFLTNLRRNRRRLGRRYLVPQGLDPDFCRQLIIQAKRRVNQIRKRKGLPPWDWRKLAKANRRLAP